MLAKFSGVWGEGELVCGDVFRHLGMEHFSSSVCYGMLMITRLTLFFPEIDLIIESWWAALVSCMVRLLHSVCVTYLSVLSSYPYFPAFLCI